jgi:hypothetical protein
VHMADVVQGLLELFNLQCQGLFVSVQVPNKQQES